METSLKGKTPTLDSPVPKRKSRLRRPPGAAPYHPHSGSGLPTAASATTPALKNNWWMVWGAGLVCLATVSLLPIVLLEFSVGHHQQPGNAVSGVHQLMDRLGQPMVVGVPNNHHNLRPSPSSDTNNNHDENAGLHVNRENTRVESVAERQLKPHYTLPDLRQAVPNVNWSAKPVARGVAGRPMAPAVVGAQRAHIECPDLNVDALAYWNSPVGDRDRTYVSPFANTNNDPNAAQPRYITFTPDRGGWNNVRMSMEIIFVLAAATGRTLVLPPKEPLYLLNKDKEARHRGYADFFPLDKLPIEIISMKEFLQREAGKLFQLPSSPTERETLELAAEACDKRAKAQGPCTAVANFLDQIGYNPGWSATHTCVVFDEEAFTTGTPSAAAQQIVQEYCGDKRTPAFWNQTVASQDILHFPAGSKDYRLLNHFYGMIYFSDPVHSHYFKRFVRDYLHYHDAIYCAAGKVVQAVQLEGKSRGFTVDDEGAGGYSAMHIRRGDLQYKRVKISAKEWYQNTNEIWLDKEILYIATDERNKTFFDDLAIHYELRFLDDYWEVAGLGNVDPNYMGMIDTIVASRGRAFAGTFFSTFTGYINRLRGYHGMSMKDSWYSFLPKKEHMHEWTTIDHVAYAFEWPDGWIGIDADVWPSRDTF